jgi:hypothetical protein
MTNFLDGQTFSIDNQNTNFYDPGIRDLSAEITADARANPWLRSG